MAQSNRSRVPAPKPGALPTGPHPDIKLREKARCGQICGQGNSTTFLTYFQRRYLRGFTEKEGSMQHLEQSSRFGVPAPKPGALWAGPHPDMKLRETACGVRRLRCDGFFLWLRQLLPAGQVVLYMIISQKAIIIWGKGGGVIFCNGV